MNDLTNALLGFDALIDKENYIRAPYGWPGGKWQSLKHIIPLIPQGDTFVDACGGSGIITINSPDWFKQKVFNDRHAGVIGFYRCLRDPIKMQKMIDSLQLYLHSREEFIWARDSWQDVNDDVERACRWYYMLRVSFGQLGRNFGRAVTGSNMLAAKFHKGIELFPEIHHRFKNVLVENQDVLDCISQFDSDTTVHYIDPDYIGTNPIYEHTVDHNRLLDIVFSLKGWVALSGYANTLYDCRGWDQRYDWPVSTPLMSAAFNEGSSLKGKENHMTRDKKATEVLWIKDFRK